MQKCYIWNKALDINVLAGLFVLNGIGAIKHQQARALLTGEPTFYSYYSTVNTDCPLSSDHWYAKQCQVEVHEVSLQRLLPSSLDPEGRSIVSMVLSYVVERQLRLPRAAGAIHNKSLCAVVGSIVTQLCSYLVA